jgi:hypothetical protein
VSAREISNFPGNYCIEPAPGIDPATSGFAAGVEVGQTDTPEGNASAMADQSHLLCNADEFHVFTTRIPAKAPVSGGLADTAARETSDVAFWFLVT